MIVRMLRPWSDIYATGLAFLILVLAGVSAPVQAEVTAFKQAVAEAAHGNESVATFYRMRDYRPVFTGSRDVQRRAALLRALERARVHGLPGARYDPDDLRQAFWGARSPRDRGRAEVLAASMMLQYAQDMQSGALRPARVDAGIVREVPRRNPVEQLQAFARSDPAAFLWSLPPTTPQYAALLAEKLRLERGMDQGGWGSAIPEGKLVPGQSGPEVIALRNRLISMGYMKRTASGLYDDGLQAAVRAFQETHGLSPDGVAGPATIAALNVPAQTRLGQVIVAMERERWTSFPRGSRHVLVNIPEFTARIIDDGKETFVTRAVVGKDEDGRLTPEFSDTMEYLVINPTWNVPRSITTGEYLPKLKRNRNAVSHLKLVDSRGRAVSRGSVNFTKYTAATFPYRLRQPPSTKNALGLVKFMFPNKYNIYLHDTPSKSLFAHDRRAYSHGCVRLADPFGFAHALLARQTDDPKGTFDRHLRSGRESRVNLEQPVPVHIIYRTAFADGKGRMNYREDVYGRDARIWEALQAAGVSAAATES